eukprot:COSAG01_NODE_12782_length_1686_cov_2.051670_2_plen_75_part_01
MSPSRYRSSCYVACFGFTPEAVAPEVRPAPLAVLVWPLSVRCSRQGVPQAEGARAGMAVIKARILATLQKLAAID